MTITLENAETLLLKRAAGRMATAGMDSLTSGGNVDLVDPLVFALLCMDIVPASPVALTDADLNGVADTDLSKLLDLAELRLLENVAGNLALVDVQVGPRQESLGQLLEQTEKAIERLTIKAEKVYGLGRGSLDSGTISLDFMTKGDDLFINEIV